MSGEDS